MITGLDVVRRLKAFQAGKPLKKGSTLHFPIADPKEILILAFLRMGGESAPWGLVWGSPGRTPNFLTAPEPRTRDLVADVMAKFAPVLLRHLFHPLYSNPKMISAADEHTPFRQIWLPNPTHLEMLHLLAYSYAFTKFGDAKRAALLRAFGRACGWIFRESQRPGQDTALVATETLRESFTFPSDDTRQGHLGFLLAWLATRGGRSARMAAAEDAERISISTSLDPAFERDNLASLVEVYNDARRTGGQRAIGRSEEQIRKVLEPELARRFSLTQQTIEILRSDGRRENLGLGQLKKLGRQEHWYQYLRLESKQDDLEDGPFFTPSPETDRYPAAAASRYYIYEASAELRDTLLLHDDEELLFEAIGAGDAIRGKIVRIFDDGTATSTRPVWVVETAGDLPLRLREGTEVCVLGLPRRKGRVRTFGNVGGKTHFEIEITGLRTLMGKNLPKGTLAAADPRLKGEEVTLVKPSADGISRAKSRKVWTKDLPGSWLTNARPVGPRADLPAEIADDLDSLVRGS